MQIKENLQQIARSYSFTNRCLLLMEECAELIQAVNKCMRARNDGYIGKQESRANLIEEMADVTIMMEQIKYLMCIDDEAVETVMQQKIERTIGRMYGYGGSEVDKDNNRYIQ